VGSGDELDQSARVSRQRGLGFAGITQVADGGTRQRVRRGAFSKALDGGIVRPRLGAQFRSAREGRILLRFKRLGEGLPNPRGYFATDKIIA